MCFCEVETLHTSEQPKRSPSADASINTFQAAPSPRCPVPPFKALDPTTPAHNPPHPSPLSDATTANTQGGVFNLLGGDTVTMDHSLNRTTHTDAPFNGMSPPSFAQPIHPALAKYAMPSEDSHPRSAPPTSFSAAPQGRDPDGSPYDTTRFTDGSQHGMAHPDNCDPCDTPACDDRVAPNIPEPAPQATPSTATLIGEHLAKTLVGTNGVSADNPEHCTFSTLREFKDTCKEFALASSFKLRIFTGGYKNPKPILKSPTSHVQAHDENMPLRPNPPNSASRSHSSGESSQTSKPTASATDNPSMVPMRSQAPAQVPTSGSLVCQSGDNCPFFIPFTVQQSGVVTLRQSRRGGSRKLICFGHNHMLCEDVTLADGNKLIHLRSRLGDDHKAYIHSVVDIPTAPNIGELRKNMGLKFKPVQFAYQMLYDYVLHRHELMYGPQADSFQKFMDWGFSLHSKPGAPVSQAPVPSPPPKFDRPLNPTCVLGGLFYHTTDLYNRVRDVVWQLPSQRDFVSVYGDFFLIDATFWANQYGDKLIPPILVDCLGKSILGGTVQSPTENADSVISGLKRLGFGHKAVMMTDEGKCWPVVAQHFHFLHILCAKHKSNHMCAGQLGLVGDLGESYRNNIRALIYNNFHTADKLDEAFRVADHEFGSHSQAAREVLQSLHSVRHKVCYTHTKEVFTCDHVSTQRSEGMFGVLKGPRGAWSNDLRRKNNMELADFLQLQFNGTRLLATQEITELVASGKRWSSWVATRLETSIRDCNTQRDVQSLDLHSDADGVQAWVLRYKAKGSGTVVTRNVTTYYPLLSDASSKPTHHAICQCSWFKSNLLPCHDIALVHNHILCKPALMQEGNLAPRWRLRNHPMYPEACSLVKPHGVVPDPSDPCFVYPSRAEPPIPPPSNPAAPSAEPNSLPVFTQDELNKVRIPPSLSGRSGALSDSLNRLRDITLKGPNVSTRYQYVMATIANIVSKLDNFRTTASEEAHQFFQQNTSGTNVTSLPAAQATRQTAAESEYNAHVCNVRMGGHQQRQTSRSGGEPPAKRAKKAGVCQTCVAWGLHPKDHFRRGPKCPFNTITKEAVSIPISFEPESLVLKPGQSFHSVRVEVDKHFPHASQKPNLSCLQAQHVKPYTAYVIVHPLSQQTNQLFDATKVPPSFRHDGYAGYEGMKAPPTPPSVPPSVAP